MKKNKIVALVVVSYLLIGCFISSLGHMPNDLPFLKKVTSVIIVMIGWPMFLIGKIFF